MLVEVYRNLNNRRLSIRDHHTKLVLGHCDRIELYKCELYVNQAGRE